MATDWGKLKEDMDNKYKDYASDGVYKVKLAEVKIHEVGTNGSIAQDFIFEEDAVQYPKATHWLSFKNDNWRKWHNRCLMVLLGLDEETAEKTVDLCEDKGKKEAIVKAYEQMYSRLAAKNPEVEIEVWQEGKYGRADFTSTSVRMSRPDDEPRESKADDILGAADDLSGEDGLGELPF